MMFKQSLLKESILIKQVQFIDKLDSIQNKQTWNWKLSARLDFDPRYVYEFKNNAGFDGDAEGEPLVVEMED